MPLIVSNKELFRQLLLLQRRGMSSARRKKTSRVKGLTWLYPYSIERTYKANLIALMKEIISFTTEEVFANIDRWITEYNLTHGRIDSSLKSDTGIPRSEKEIREDAYPDDLKDLILAAKDKADEILETNPAARIMLSTTGFNLSIQNKKQWGKFLKKIIGVDFVLSEPWEEETIKAWGETNFGLIKGLSDEHVKKVNTIVSEGIQFGRTAASMRTELRKVNKQITEKRAALIARDQVGKLHGQLTKRRQEDVGLDLYIWVTVGDERVRGKPGGRFPNAVPSHHIMDGKICKWGDNTVYSDDRGETFKKRAGKMPKAIPGQEIQCRCSAIPFFDDLMEEVDLILKNEEEKG